jgi:hypothetical protein
MERFAAAATANVIGLLVPCGVVTVMFRAPAAAVDAMFRAVVREVWLRTVTELVVIPDPLTATVVDPATKKVPVRVTPTDVPWAPAAILVEVSVGGCPWTVNVTALLEPCPVPTVTFRGPGVAEAAIVNVAVKAIELDAVTALAITPVPLTKTLVPPETKFVPLSVTLTVAFCTPEGGFSDVSVGGGATGSEILAMNMSLPPPPDA